MPTDRDLLDLDERTAWLGRELFADVRKQQRELLTAEKRHQAQRDDGTDNGLWDALFGNGESDGDGSAGGSN